MLQIVGGLLPSLNSSKFGIHPKRPEISKNKYRNVFGSDFDICVGPLLASIFFIFHESPKNIVLQQMTRTIRGATRAKMVQRRSATRFS